MSLGSETANKKLQPRSTDADPNTSNLKGERIHEYTRISRCKEAIRCISGC